MLPDGYGNSHPLCITLNNIFKKKEQKEGGRTSEKRSIFIQERETQCYLKELLNLWGWTIFGIELGS